MTQRRVDIDFEALAHLISDGIAFISAEGLIAGWSDGAVSVTGIRRADALGKSLHELFLNVEPPLGFAVVPEPMTLWGNDEARRTFHAVSLSIDGGWVVSFGPQTRFAAIEQLKSEIVAAVSHELKTPIATIKAFATTMRQNPDATEGDRDEYLATIEEQADRLANAVEDLLLAGRVDAEHLLTQRRSVSVDEVVDLAAERIGPSAAARVERHTAGVTVDCDSELLAAAIVHLLENALKFSPDGAPVVIDATRDEAVTTISVRDRGIGIAEDHLPYVFERFYRVERTLAASTGGKGLGLFVVRAIARAHGGSIHVESRPNEGSTFSLRLPVRT